MYLTKINFKIMEKNKYNVYFQNVTRDVFGNMPHLQWLDISHNYIRELDFDAFKNTKDLQVSDVAFSVYSRGFLQFVFLFRS